VDTQRNTDRSNLRAKLPCIRGRLNLRAERGHWRSKENAKETAVADDALSLASALCVPACVCVCVSVSVWLGRVRLGY